jgi:cytoskeleton protein RodZ
MLDHAGLGAHLRQCRKSRGLSLEDVSETTRIALRHLRALEEERLLSLPAPVFVRGYIRAYCSSVGEPATQALCLYERARVAATPPPPPPAPAPEPVLARRSAWSALIVMVGLLVLGGALYLIASPHGAGSEPAAPEASR